MGSGQHGSKPDVQRIYVRRGNQSTVSGQTPGKMANAGTMNHSFFHVRDIMPTILDLAEIEHSVEFNGRKVRPMQGKSVLGLFAGKVETPYAEASQVGYELFGLKAFFVGDWKILWMPKPFGTGEWELFNLETGPRRAR